MEGDTGFEPVRADSQKHSNSDTETPQNRDKSSPCPDPAKACLCKSATLPEHKKHTLLHEKCATSVQQNLDPDLAQLASAPEHVQREAWGLAWPELPVAVRDGIVRMVKAARKVK
ncbi:MAG: hypothetical protein A2V67_09215 [Deltaproteobacteria bacterium RBG_13_61_14]|nr:MAG: hypothetical protein A2V67_09215 [Deltaproteobacteria bacterium RBG_13_61_14]